MESLKSETVKYLLYALVMVGFLIALINNFDTFMQGVNAGIDDVFGNNGDS
jgi:bacteriorhodopsin